MESGTLITQKYRLKQKIGDGATSEVWEAAHVQTARPVAIKLILRTSEVFRHRLLREARLCGEISHRNVIEVLDAGQMEDGGAYLVMPLLRGETLANLIARQFRIEVPTAAQIGRDIARALAAAHAKTIIHRDLKPANIFMHNESGGDGAVVKVLDFGIGKNLSAEESMATIAGGMLGSPAYMSPEQVRCDPNVDHRTDIWSLGVMLFEMISGRRPFEGATAKEVVGKIARGEVPQLSRYIRHIDPSLEALVWRCMQVDRELRANSADELAKMLDGFAGAGESMTSAPPPTEDNGPSSVNAEEVDDDAGPTLKFQPNHAKAMRAAAMHDADEAPTSVAGLAPNALSTPLPSVTPSIPSSGGQLPRPPGFVPQQSTLKMNPKHLEVLAKGNTPKEQGPRGTIKLKPNDVPPSLAAARASRDSRGTLPFTAETPLAGSRAVVTTNVPLSLPQTAAPPVLGPEVRTKLSMQPAWNVNEEEMRAQRLRMAVAVGAIAAVLMVLVVLGGYSLVSGDRANENNGRIEAKPGMPKLEPRAVESAGKSGEAVAAPTGSAASPAGPMKGGKESPVPRPTPIKAKPSRGGNRKAPKIKDIQF